MPKLPTPFRRPSIDLSPKGKTWKHIPAKDVRIDFIIADFGLVKNINTGDFGLELVNVGDIHWLLDEDDIVFAFGHHG